MVPLSFAHEEFLLADGRALFWPREQALLVADLHLEKASFFARYGQMLPPYDSRETLERVAGAIRPDLDRVGPDGRVDDHVLHTRHGRPGEPRRPRRVEHDHHPATHPQ